MARTKPRAPRPRAVILGSLALFVVLFAVLTLQLSVAASPSKRRSGAGKVAARSRSEPEAGAATDAEPAYEEPEYVEPEYEEPVYVEPEYEEAPPVVTQSS